MLRSRQIEQRIKQIQKSTSPKQTWGKKRSLLSCQSSGDIKWGDDTRKKHEAAATSTRRNYANVMSSPRGDVELADFTSSKPPSFLNTPRVLSPVRKSIDFDGTPSQQQSMLTPRTSLPKPMQTPRSVSRSVSPSPDSKKMYVSDATKRVMRLTIENELHAFPVRVSNLALCLSNSKEIVDSLVDSSVEADDSDDMMGLGGLMSISLSEDYSDRDAKLKQKSEEYKSSLKGLITRGNDATVMNWGDVDEVLREVFLLGKVGLADLGESGEEDKEEDEVAIVSLADERDDASVAATAAAPIVSLASTSPRYTSKTSKKRYLASKAFKAIPKKAFPSPIKSKFKTKVESIARKVKKKDPSHLGLEEYRKKIQNKVGQSLWNSIFTRPHHLTPQPIQDTEKRFDEKIEALEKYRVSKTDEILARRAEDEKAREAEERASSLLRPLSKEEESIVKKALYGVGPPNEILASQDADSVQRSSMQRLQPGEWLNDEIINYFLKNCLAKRDEKLCAAQPGRKRSHFFNSYFVQTLFDEKNNNASLRGKYAYKNVKRWSKKVPGKDVFNLKYIICPINLDNMHWTSAVIFMEEKKIQYFDSLGGTDRRKLQGLLEYLKDEWRAKKGGEMDVSEWKLVECTRDTPRQLNGYDCGVFTCMFSDFISNDCPLTFSQEHVNQCRERIALSIMKNCAIE